MTIKKILSLFILTLFTSAFFMPLSAYASMGEEVKEALKVNAAWIEDEMLQVDVTNINTGENQKLEVQLKDYTSESEYVSVQAVDADGNKSNIVQIKNPYYKAEEVVDKNKTNKPADKIETEKTDEPAKENNKNAFTPAGTGEVMDNAKDGDGKEFFTIKTKSDNVFYLIVDRQRESDNVYLLNAVSESDLVALAEKGEDTSISAVPEPEITEQTESAAETEEAKTSSAPGSNLSAVVLIFIAVIIVGGVGYYIKIYKPKHSDSSVSHDEDFDGEDSEYEASDEDFEGEYEDNEGAFDVEKEFEEDVISVDDEKSEE